MIDATDVVDEITHSNARKYRYRERIKSRSCDVLCTTNKYIYIKENKRFWVPVTVIRKAPSASGPRVGYQLTTPISS